MEEKKDAKKLIVDQNLVALYSNQLQNKGFYGLSERETKLFMTIIAKMRDKGESASFSYKELIDAMGLAKKNMTTAQFTELFQTAAKKIAFRSIKKDTGGYLNICLFDLIESYPDRSYDNYKGRVDVTLSPRYAYMLQNMEACKSYTSAELREFISLSGKNALTLYRHLRQFRTTGYRRMTVENIISYFELPENCETKYIKYRVIDQACDELRKLNTFKNMSVKTEKEGKRIVAYHFIWSKAGQIQCAEAIQKAETK